MTYVGLITLGAIVAVASIVASVAIPGAPFAVLAFAGGALFGKGYGIYEEREREAR